MIELFIIFILGTFLRIIGIVKPDGLWNDEYVSWQIASTSFSDGFTKAMLAQCHMPFYYLYLKMCMFFGGDNDTFLRITSVIPGILSIIVMYFVGLQYNKKCAVFSALIASVSSFLIYYSQEVRLYSLLFLISAITLLYLLKYLKNKTLTNLAGLIIFNFLIMFTHTIGFVFVFFELLVLSILIFKEYKRQILYFWASASLLFAILAPNIYHILSGKTFSQWWGVFSISKIGFLFTDYFSPILTNLVNAPNKFLYNNNLTFLFFMLCPALIALIFIIRAIYKNKQNFALFIIAFCTVTIMIIAAIMGKLVFITKYSIEIYPILIFLAAYGASKIKTKYLGTITMSIFCIINLWYLIFSPISAPKKTRPEGHKLVAELLNRANAKKGDIIFIQYYGTGRFKKYFDFSDYKIVTVNKGNFHKYLTANNTYEQIKQNGKEIYKPIFENSNMGYFEYKMQKEVLSNMKKGQNLLIIVCNSVAFYNTDVMSQIIKDEYTYNQIPLMFLIFSYVSNHSVSYFEKTLQLTRIENLGTWSLIKFTK